MEERLQVGKATRSTPRIHPSLRALVNTAWPRSRGLGSVALVDSPNILTLKMEASDDEQDL